MLKNKGLHGPSPVGVQSVRDERKARINGTVVHTTAISGFTLSGWVIQDIVGKNG